MTSSTFVSDAVWSLKFAPCKLQNEEHGEFGATSKAPAWKNSVEDRHAKAIKAWTCTPERMVRDFQHQMKFYDEKEMIFTKIKNASCKMDGSPSDSI